MSEGDDETLYLKMWPLVGFPCSNGRLHIHAYIQALTEPLKLEGGGGEAEKRGSLVLNSALLYLGVWLLTMPFVQLLKAGIYWHTTMPS